MYTFSFQQARAIPFPYQTYLTYLTYLTIPPWISSFLVSKDREKEHKRNVLRLSLAMTILMQVVKEAIAARPASQQILFDGIPRDADQKKDFDAIMKEVGRDFRCIHLLLDPEEGLQRIFGRAKAEGRADDSNEEIIRRRMKTFTEKTMPVIAEYKRAGKVKEIDGKGTVEEIYGELKKTIA